MKILRVIDVLIPSQVELGFKNFTEIEDGINIHPHSTNQLSSSQYTYDFRTLDGDNRYMFDMTKRWTSGRKTIELDLNINHQLSKEELGEKVQKN